MRQLFLIILVWCCQDWATNAQSVDRVPMQLSSRIMQSKADTNRIKLLLQLGKYYLDKRGEHKENLDSAIVFFKRAEQLSKTLNSTKWLYATLELQGAYYIKVEDIQKAKNCFHTIINDYKKSENNEQEGLAWKKFGDLFDPENKATNAEQLKCYANARQLFVLTTDKLNEAKVTESVANVHLNEKKLDLAQQELLKVIDQYQSVGYKKLQHPYDLLAEVSKLKVDLHKELSYRMEAIKSMEADRDTTHAAYYYARAALVYSDLGEYSQSADFIMRSLQILRKNDPDGDFYGDLSLYIYDMIKSGKPQGAIDYLNEVTVEVPPKNLAQKVDLNEGYGNAYKALGQYKQAEQYYLEMMRIYQRTYNSKDLYSTNYQMLTDYIHYYQTMGEFYILINEYKKAGFYLNKILSLPKNDVRPITLSRINHSMFQVDSALGNYVTAIRHFEIYKKLNDSLYDVTKHQQISELMIKYETEKKEQSIKVLKSESKRQYTELQKVNLERNLTLGGVVMLIIISGIAYKGYRNKQHSNRLLQSKQEEINSKNISLQNLLNDKDKLLTEKDWLLKEVHHRVKNNLQIVMSLLNTQSAYLENNAAITAIKESQNRVQAISLIHQKLYSASDVASIDMRAYVSDLVNYLKDCLDTTNRNIRFDLLIEDIRIDLAQAVPLGLILNEAITNAIKYAFDEKGGAIIVGLQWIGDENLLLTVADGGKGLPADFDIKKATSLGMEMMKALSKQLGGRFEVKNKPGVTIMIEFFAERVLYTMDNKKFYLS
jgi:two-component sensor histidine kinase